MSTGERARGRAGLGVSWQLAAFGILALALTVGFWWYERTRPDARIVALVGTLAAFAALGRIAFAALPNVKPTSDIVLISGYALGGGPGFAVGAIAGLASNFFFGQGPWTPWQMAAWGVTGIVGAGLALVFRRTIGRWPLAIACCVCGFAFTAVQDAGDWITYSDHSFTQLVVYVGQGLGFDAIYAGSCLVFALAFGPALLRSIQRFTKRLEITWLAPGSSVTPLVAVAVALVGTAAVVGGARTPTAHAARMLTARAASGVLEGPVNYLRDAQNDDGGFGAQSGQPSSSLFAGWAALGLESAGVRLQSVNRGPGLIAYLQRAAGAADAGSIERNLLVARAAGLSATDFGGHDLVAMLRAKFTGDGSVGGVVNLTTFGILALRAAGLAVPARTEAWLLAQQDRDGGFGFGTRGGASDVDDTGAVLEAMASVPGARASAVRAHAIGYVRRQQDQDGGFPSQTGQGSNAQSTAWAVQGLDAAGVNPAGVHQAGGPPPLAYLQSLIGRDGSIAYARGQAQTPVWVTGEALMALAGKPLPLAPLSGPAATPARAPNAPAPAAGAPKSTTRSASSPSAATTTAATAAATATTAAGAVGAAGRGARGQGRAAGRRSLAPPADSAAKTPAGDGPAGLGVVGAVLTTATQTLTALRALM
jgi:energy-coupling factor transport system substrate-specific component